jgi:protein-S-isoprenylcysteine O-methyltransferase Ste14
VSPSLIFSLSWGLWLFSWLVAACWSSPAVVRAPSRQSLAYNLPIVIGVWALFPALSRYLHAPRLWPIGHEGALVLAFLTVPCFLFAWWGRIELGNLWSGTITRKGDHRIIDKGPYAIVRHPIYTGIVGASLMTAIAVATIPAILGAAMIVYGLWLKARTEERFLAEELGGEAYAAYRRKVPMLIPFLPASR